MYEYVDIYREREREWVICIYIYTYLYIYIYIPLSWFSSLHELARLLEREREKESKREREREIERERERNIYTNICIFVYTCIYMFKYLYFYSHAHAHTHTPSLSLHSSIRAGRVSLCILSFFVCSPLFPCLPLLVAAIARACWHCNTLQHTATYCNTLQHSHAQLEPAVSLCILIDYFFFLSPPLPFLPFLVAAVASACWSNAKAMSGFRISSLSGTDRGGNSELREGDR